jgi:tetratricopeptide (TPR) repeat protein
MLLRIQVLLVVLLSIAVGRSPALGAPKIIEGFQSTATPGGTSAPSGIDDPEKLFGDVTPQGDGDLGDSGPSVWDMPLIQLQAAQLRLATAALFQQGKLEEAEARLKQSVELIPHDPAGHYLLASLHAKQGKKDEALASLAEAVKWGFNQSEAMDRDPNFESLNGNLEFAKLIAAAKSAQTPANPWRHRVTPAVAHDGSVSVNASNTAWDPKNGLFIHLLQPLPAKKTEIAVAGSSELVAQINRWYAEGTAAGNFGDFYDNHDGGHSPMNQNEYPQLTFIRWDGETQKRQFHTGLQARSFFNAVVLGNSSTALVNGPFWRSQPRLAYVNQRSMAVLYAQYTKNHLYFYPEHADHDPGHGDVYPVNTPYVVISQGSSGSDRVFLNAFAWSLAALRPEVKAKLVKAGALMPALQMVFRMTNKPVAAPEDYLTGAAHPTVFDGGNLQAEKMVALAHDLKADDLPPLVRMKVVEDDNSVVGKDYFDVGPRQELVTTPSAIARVHRTSRYKYRMVISAEESVDLNGRPLTYHWKLLRGDDALVKIKPLNESGSVVELVVPFHDKRPIAEGSPLVSNRVDIGCFVHNGVYYSAPGFVSFFTLANERRSYYEDETPQFIQYNMGGDYVDPMIDVPKAWKDNYKYDGTTLLGWVRERDGSKESFTPDGALIVSRDEKGRALTARTVKYVAERKAEGDAPTLVQQPGDEILHYKYGSPAEKVGIIERREKVAP